MSLFYNQLYEDVEPDNDFEKRKYSQAKEVVAILCKKLDLLSVEKRPDALKIIKALAFFKFKERGVYRGVEIETLADNLDLAVAGQDRIRGILEELREKTGNQFIDRASKNCYTLDVVHNIDYQQQIEERSRHLNRQETIEGFNHYLCHSLNLDEKEEIEQGIYEDSFPWPERNSYRICQVVLGGNRSEGFGEFTLVFDWNRERVEEENNRRSVLLNLQSDREIEQLIRKFIIYNSLTGYTNYPQRYLRNSLQNLQDKLKSNFLHIFLQGTLWGSGWQGETVQEVVSSIESLKSAYRILKSKLFASAFATTFPDYPRLEEEININNHRKKLEDVIRKLVNKGLRKKPADPLFSSLLLLDEDGYLSVANSIYGQKLLQELENSPEGKTKIGAVYELLGSSPYGLNRELIYVLLIALTYLGKIKLYRKNGMQIDCQQLENFFLSNMSLFSFGLDKMEKLGEIRKNDVPLRSMNKSLKILGVQPAVMTEGSAGQRLFLAAREQILSWQRKIDRCEVILEEIKKETEFVPSRVITGKLNGLNDLMVREWKKLRAFSDLHQLALTEPEREKLAIALKYIDNLTEFLQDMKDSILPLWQKLIRNEDKKVKEEIISHCRDLLINSWEIIDEVELREKLKSELKIFFPGRNF
ncbi:MAG: DUF6079 family protein [Halanaerobiales bacterium]